MNNIEKKKKPNQTNENNKMLLFLFLFWFNLPNKFIISSLDDIFELIMNWEGEGGGRFVYIW